MSALIRLRVSAACVAALVAVTNSAAADAPACARARGDGSDAAMAEGFASYRAALGKTIDEAKVRAAIAAFDRSCALGEPKALEWRAFAFVALGDHEHAAESLVAFARATPYGSLPEEDRDRVRDAVDALNAAGVTPKLTLLRVSSSTPATVRIDGVDYGVSPAIAIVRAERVVVDVTAAGYEDARRDVDTSAGGDAQTSIDLAPAVRSEPITPRVRALDSEPRSEWPMRIAIGAGVAAATAIAFTVWRESRVSAYDETPCPTNRAAATGECASILDQFETARALQITSILVTLALTGTAVTWWLLDRGDAPSTKTAAFLRPLLPGGLEF